MHTIGLLKWVWTFWCAHLPPSLPPSSLAIYSLSPLRGFSATHPHFFTSHTFEPASCSVHTFLTLPHTYTGHTFQLTTLTHFYKQLSGEITESLKKHAHACHGKTWVSVSKICILAKMSFGGWLQRFSTILQFEGQLEYMQPPCQGYPWK